MFKKLLGRMGLKANKVVTGEEAQRQISQKQLSQSGLTDKEIQFILTKLRQAQYSGAEFEFFHTVFLKLSNLLKK